MDIARVDLVHDLSGRVAQHAFGTNVEYLNDALLVGGDYREIGAVKNRILQGTGFKQRILSMADGDGFQVPHDIGKCLI